MSVPSYAKSYDQLDWRTEVAVGAPRGKAKLAEWTENCVAAWVLTEARALPTVSRRSSMAKRCNCARVLQYFHARFIYSHAKFYGHSLEDPDYVGQAKRLAEKIREKFGPVEARSAMPLSMLEQLNDLLVTEIKLRVKG